MLPPPDSVFIFNVVRTHAFNTLLLLTSISMQTSDGAWHAKVTSALSPDAKQLVLTLTGMPAGTSVIATRGMFAGESESMSICTYCHIGEGESVRAYTHALHTRLYCNTHV